MKSRRIFKKYWKDTTKVAFADEGAFGEWLDYIDLALGYVIVDGTEISIEDFRKELFGNKDFLYLTHAYINTSDNSFLIKDNLDREFYIQDKGMEDLITEELIDIEELDEEITPVLEGEMPF